MPAFLDSPDSLGQYESHQHIFLNVQLSCLYMPTEYTIHFQALCIQHHLKSQGYLQWQEGCVLHF